MPSSCSHEANIRTAPYSKRHQRRLVQRKLQIWATNATANNLQQIDNAVSGRSEDEELSTFLPHAAQDETGDGSQHNTLSDDICERHQPSDLNSLDAEDEELATFQSHVSQDETDGDQQQHNILFDYICGNHQSSDLSSRNDSDADPQDTASDCSDHDESPFRERIADWLVRHQIKQSAADALLAIFRQEPWGVDFPKSSRTLLKTPQQVAIRKVSNGEYYHVGLEKKLKEVLMEAREADRPEKLKLQIGSDGLSISASSGSTFWPIVGSIKNMPHRNIFLIGLFHGFAKPSDPNEFLREFVDEASGLLEKGICLDNKRYAIEILCFIADCPARSFLTCTKGHNGYSACPFCLIEGDYVDNRVVYLDESNAARTNASFRNRNDEDHHTGTSLLEAITTLDMVQCFPVDPMHLIYLGITRKLLLIWICGPTSVKMPRACYERLCNNLIIVSGDMTVDFARKPRSLDFIKRWKATEFRQFLLYTGPVVLRNCIRKRVLYHFQVLHVAIRLLSSPNYYLERNSESENLIALFLNECVALYGPQIMSLNFHCLRHVPQCARRFGPTEEFSAFPIESFIGQLKRRLRSGRKPLAQVAKRLSELENSSLKTNSNCCAIQQSFRMAHTDGPLTDSTAQRCWQQFKICQLTSSQRITTNAPDNCVILNDATVVVVVNFLRSTDGHGWLIGNRFREKKDLYTYPLKSSEIGIFAVSVLEAEFSIWPLTAVEAKAVKLKIPRLGPVINDYYAVFPLLHHESM